MSNLKKWGELYAAHKETGRPRLIVTLFRGKTIWQAWRLWVSVLAYLSVSVCAICMPNYFFVAVSIILVSAFLVYLWLDVQIKREYVTRYKLHGLERHPFLSRSKHLSYVLFVERILAGGIVSKSDVGDLLEWRNAKDIKIDLFGFFKNSIVLLFLSLTVGVVLQIIAYHVERSGLLNFKLASSLLLLFFSILWILWAIFDLFNSEKRKDLEIARFLTWWKLEK